MGRLEENVGAVDVELTAEDLREIDDAAGRIVVQGARRPERSELVDQLPITDHGPVVEFPDHDRRRHLDGNRRLNSGSYPARQ